MLEKHGFTMIEIIMVIATVGIIAIFGFQFFPHLSHSYSMMKGQNMLYHEAITAMERMSREIRDAVTIEEVSQGKIKILKAHGTPVDPYLYVTFILDNGVLKRGSNTTVSDPSIYTALAENIKNNGFTVSNPSGDEIILMLELSDTSGGNFSVQSKICPKNIPFPLGLEYCGRNFNGDWEEIIQ
ncbi:MAG: type II secretion system protein J [bacterium]